MFRGYVIASSRGTQLEMLIDSVFFFVQDALIKHEEAGTTESKEYQDAMAVFYNRHLCRVDPWPADVLKSFEWMEKDHTVYYTM